MSFGETAQARTMSKFFGGDSSSEEESSSEDEEEVVQEEVEEKPAVVAAKPGGKTGAAAFMKGDDSDDSDNEGKRVVKSHRDKKWDAMTDTVNQLKNDMKINDWNALAKTFDTLEKMLAKAHQLVAKEGIPKFYFKALISLDDFVNKTNENNELKKKMNTLNAKAFNGMKQKIKKLTRQYEGELEKVKAEKSGGDNKNDDSDDDDDDEDDSDDSDDSDGDSPPLKGKSAFMKAPAAKPKADAEAKVPEKKVAEKPVKAAPKGPKPISEYNEGEIDERLDKLLAVRGRKGTNKQEQIDVLGQVTDCER